MDSLLLFTVFDTNFQSKNQLLLLTKIDKSLKVIYILNVFDNYYNNVLYKLHTFSKQFGDDSKINRKNNI